MTITRILRTAHPYVGGTYVRGAGHAISTAMASVTVIDTDAGLQGRGEMAMDLALTGHHCAKSPVDMACLDMLTMDIADGSAPRNLEGYLHLPDDPGLGVHPDEAALGDPVANYEAKP